MAQTVFLVKKLSEGTDGGMRGHVKMGFESEEDAQRELETSMGSGRIVRIKVYGEDEVYND